MITSTPLSPRERSIMTSNKSREDSPSMEVSPEKRMVFPEVARVWATASSFGCRFISSLNRLTTSRE